MADLHLELLGEFRTFLGQESLDSFRTKKVQALLIYLTVEPEAQSRDNLTTLLWPGMPDRSARSNLRQTIYQLRKIVDEAAVEEQERSNELLIINRHSIRLNPAADVVVDTSQFEAHLARSQSHDHLDLLTCGDCRQDLLAAAELYRGNFLEDFYLDDSNNFEEWAQDRREGFLRQMLDALEVLAAMHSRQHEYGRARLFAERQLEIDNLREPAYRQLMEVLALSGQRTEAMAVYESCRRLFAEELGMAPSRRTTEMYEQIRAGDLSFEPVPGQGVRGYELKDEIGEGAFGSIHRAIQPSISREVAVKVIRRKYANDPDFIRRFEFEAQTVAHLEHPHVVPLYDYWRDPEGAYLVMRYLKGGSLLSALETGPWEPEAAAGMLDQVAGALSAAHQQGIVHRDIKPANILLDEAGNAYLSDFGIAKDLMEEMQLTADGAVMGTPDYISPEQILNDPVTAQTDIYSLGAVLYEVLTGERPFGDTSVANLIYKHLNEPIARLSESRPDLPPQVDEVIQRATAKQPADRYATALEMAAAFRAAVQGISTGVTRPITGLQVKELYNPYKGLRAFQESDADDFFGREALIDQLIDRLGQESPKGQGGTRFLAVVGPSGSGKSSAVKAGLIPALRNGALPGSEKWFVAEMVPGTHPLEELEMALWPVAVDPPPSLVEPMERDTRGMLRTIRRILPDEPGAQLLLVIDQSEELFTLVDDEERRSFFIDSLLAALNAPRSPLRVVVTLRADFYDRPLHYPQFGELVRSRMETIMPLSTDELERAITLPAERVGVNFEPGLVSSIIGDVTDQPGALPLLQYALTELFDQRRGRFMTREAYQAIGGTVGALAKRAEEFYLSMNEREQALIRQIFLRLVTLGEGREDTRRRTPRSELQAISDDEGVDEIIDTFVAYRLLSVDTDPGTRVPTVEVAHEALLREWERLRGWLDASRDDIRRGRLLSRAAEEWDSQQRDASYLLRGSRLEQTEEWLQNTELVQIPLEREFIAASLQQRAQELEEERARQEREARLERRSRNFLRGLVAVFALAAVIAGGLSILAFNLNRQSQASAAGFRSIALASGAQEALDNGRPDEALALVREAVQTEDPPFNAQQTFTHISGSTWIKQRIPASEARVRDAIYHPNGDWIITASFDGRVRIWDRITGEEIKSVTVDGAPQLGYLALDPSQEIVAVTGFEGELWLWNIVTDELTKLVAGNGWHGAPIFTPDGSQLIAMSGDTINIWDMETLTVQRSFVAHPGMSFIPSIRFNQDASQLITAAGDGYVRAWDLATGELVRELDHNVLDSEEPFWLYEAQLLHDDQWLLTVGTDHLTLWDWQSGEIIWMIENGGSLGNKLILDEEWFVSGSDSRAQLYHTATGALIREYWGHAGGSSEVDIHPQGDFFITSNSDGTVIEWPLWWEGSQRILPLPVWDVYVSAMHPSRPIIALAQDPEFSVKGYFKGSLSSIYLVNIQTGEVVQELTGHRGNIGSLAFTPDGRYLLSGDDAPLVPYEEQQLYVWDWERGERISEFSEHVGWVLAIDVSPDGTLVASGDAAGSNIYIWDLLMGEVVHHLTGHEDWVQSLVFSPDGQWLYSTGIDGHVYRWDVATGELVQEYGEGIGGVLGAQMLAINSDGTRLVATFDGVAANTFVWDVDSGELILTLPKGGVFAFNGNDSLGAVYSFTDGIITLWDMATGQLQHQYAAYQPNTFGRIAFNSDYSQIISVADGQLIAWDVPETFVPLETWVTENRYIPDFTCEQRELYVIEPLCEQGGADPQ